MPMPRLCPNDVGRSDEGVVSMFVCLASIYVPVVLQAVIQ